VQEEQHRPVADPGQLGAESAFKPLLLMLPDHGGLVLLPLFAKRGIRDAVVELVGGQLVVGQSAAELDVLGQVPARIGLDGLEQHGCETDRVGLRFQLLPIGHDDRCDGVTVPQGVHMFHPVGQKAAGPAGRVIEGPDQAGVVDEHLVIRVEQQLDCQVDHVARGHEILGRLVHLRPEAADQVFVDVGHHPFRNRVRVQVDGGEVLADLVEDPGLIHPGQRVREVELFEDDPGVVGE